MTDFFNMTKEELIQLQERAIKTLKDLKTAYREFVALNDINEDIVSDVFLLDLNTATDDDFRDLIKQARFVIQERLDDLEMDEDDNDE